MAKATPLLRNRHSIDATGLALGRLAVKVSTLLRGKHKATFQPHKDEGDIVEVLNVSKLSFTGKKLSQKEYHHYSGYLCGLKSKKMSEVYLKNPGEVLYRAVRDMLPPTKLRVGYLKRLIIK